MEEADARTLLLLVRQADGSVRLAGLNRRIIQCHLCEGEGGSFDVTPTGSGFEVSNTTGAGLVNAGVGFRPSSEVQKFANGRRPAKSGLSARECSFLRSCRSFVSAGLSSTAMQRDRLHRAATLGGIGLNTREDAAC